MSYTLYLGNNCHDCDRVLKRMKGSTMEFQYFNVDEGEEEPPIYMHIFPCLFEDGELLAFGNDIVEHLEKKGLLKKRSFFQRLFS